MLGMLEIIKREEGFKAQKELIHGYKTQISYNSDGLLVIRIIQKGTKDTLIVCDRNTTKEIIKFCKYHILDDRTASEIPF